MEETHVEHHPVSVFYTNVSESLIELPDKIDAYDDADARSNSDYTGESFYINAIIPHGLDHEIAVVIFELISQTVQGACGNPTVSIYSSTYCSFCVDDNQWMMTAEFQITPNDNVAKTGENEFTINPKALSKFGLGALKGFSQ